MAIASTSANGRENKGGSVKSSSPPLFRKAASGIARAIAFVNFRSDTNRHLKAEELTPKSFAVEFSRSIKSFLFNRSQSSNDSSAAAGISTAAAKLLANCSTRLPPNSLASSTCSGGIAFQVRM